MADLIEKLREIAEWDHNDFREITDIGPALMTARDAANEIEALRRQNRELVTEIKIRDGVISNLQSRLAALEDEGWQLMPRQATDEMIAAAEDVGVGPRTAGEVYRVMHAAAPKIRGEM